MTEAESAGDARAAEQPSPKSQAQESRKSRWPERVAIGRVAKAHGVRGEVALEAWGDLGKHLRKQTEFTVGGVPRRLTGVRGAHDRIIGGFEGFDSRDQAETLRGAVIEIPSELLSLPQGEEFYLFELEDCLVKVSESEDQGWQILGSVSRIIEDGGGLILEVESESADEHHDDHQADERKTFLIPFVAAFLDTMDLSQGELSFRLPEGLLETCVSTS